VRVDTDGLRGACAHTYWLTNRIWALATKSASIAPSKPPRRHLCLDPLRPKEISLWPEWNGQITSFAASIRSDAFSTPATPATVSQGWPEWEPRTFSFAKFEPQRSFFGAAVGLKWSCGGEDLGSAQQVLGSIPTECIFLNHPHACSICVVIALRIVVL
jgi:hypothetical protein